MTYTKKQLIDAFDCLPDDAPVYLMDVTWELVIDIDEVSFTYEDEDKCKYGCIISQALNEHAPPLWEEHPLWEGHQNDE